MPTDITADLERVEELVQQAIAKSQQQHPSQPRPRQKTAGRLDKRLFQPDERTGCVATHIISSYFCPTCERDIKGERIKLVEYKAGRQLVFHTDDGHQLHYRGHVLLRVDCDEPIIARSVP